jgi:hypothetical protein
VKTDKYYIEKYGGIAVGIIFALISFFIFKPVYNTSWDYLLTKSFDLGIGTFGFLLAVLALIVQGDSSAIQKIKAREILYRRFVLYNKKIVFLSITICFYSIVVKLINDGLLLGNNSFIQHVDLSLYLFLITWFLIDTYRFLKVFYIVIVNPK